MTWSQDSISFLKELDNSFLNKTVITPQNEVLFFGGLFLGDAQVGTEILTLDENNDLFSLIKIQELNDSVLCEKIYHYWHYENNHYFISTGVNTINNENLILFFSIDEEFRFIELIETIKLNFRDEFNIPYYFKFQNEEGLVIADYKNNSISKIWKIEIINNTIETDFIEINSSLNLSFISDIIFDDIIANYYIKGKNCILKLNSEFDNLVYLPHKSMALDGSVSFSVWTSKFLNANNGVIKLISETVNFDANISYMLEEIHLNDDTIISNPISLITDNDNVELLFKRQTNDNKYIFYSANVLNGNPRELKILKFNNEGDFQNKIIVEKDNRRMVLLDININDNGVIAGCGYFLQESKNFYFILSPEDEFTVSSKNVIEIEKISVYPNPANNVLNISVSDDLEYGSIYDINGRVIKEINAFNNIDISNLSASIYHLILTTKKGEVISKSFIKN